VTVAATTALAVRIASGAGEAKHAATEIHVGDHGLASESYFKPTHPTIHKGDKLTWTWDSDSILDHSVKLREAPKGVRKKRFYSGPRHYPTDDFTARFKVRGKYKFFCEYHPGIMKMTVTVKR
jgi:plastocyanin